MKCFVLTGDDDWAMRARRAELLTEAGIAAQNVEKFDLDDGGVALATAASTFSLFGGARLLDASPADGLSPENAASLARRSTDVTIILRGPSAVPAAVKKALADVASFESFRTPSGSAAATRIVELARAHQITLSAEVRATLVDRGAHDLPRVASILSQLESIGLTSPTEAQISKMLGSSAAPGVPWALADALESGDVATALALSSTLEPVAVVNYLSSRTGQVGRVVDDELRDPDAIMGAFGMSSRFPAQKLSRLADRLGKEGVAYSWDLLAAADRAVKVSPDPRAAMDVLIVRLSAAWSRQGPAVRKPLPR